MAEVDICGASERAVWNSSNTSLDLNVDEGKALRAGSSAGRGMRCRGFNILEDGKSGEETQKAKEEQMAAILEKFFLTSEDRTRHFLGYQVNLDHDYTKLSKLLKFSLNNVGDPFVESNYGINSREFEVGVLNWFARLWEIEENDFWGYVTNGGTEANLHGILIGREMFPNGVFYASKDSHYSVFKAAWLFRMKCVKIKTLISGSIDCEDLRLQLSKNGDKPAILNVNIGTTMKGAVDDVDHVIETLKATGFSEDRFYIHCDGALFGLMLPFLRDAPQVTFKKPIGSISVSGHKFIGSPMPCGVQITRAKYAEKLSTSIEYIATLDATILGSRNGHAPIFLWYTLKKKGYKVLENEVNHCLRNANYLLEKLKEAGIGAMLNPLSTTVLFERPYDETFVRKWQLSCEGNVAHVVVMQNVSINMLDRFMNGLITVRGDRAPRCVADGIGPENCVCVHHLSTHSNGIVARGLSYDSLNADPLRSRVDINHMLSDGVYA